MLYEIFFVVGGEIASREQDKEPETDTEIG